MVLTLDGEAYREVGIVGNEEAIASIELSGLALHKLLCFRKHKLFVLVV